MGTTASICSLVPESINDYSNIWRPNGWFGGVRIRLEEERSGCGTRCYVANTMKMQLRLYGQKTIEVAHGLFRAVFERSMENKCKFEVCKVVRYKATCKSVLRIVGKKVHCVSLLSMTGWDVG